MKMAVSRSPKPQTPVQPECGDGGAHVDQSCRPWSTGGLARRLLSLSISGGTPHLLWQPFLSLCSPCGKADPPGPQATPAFWLQPRGGTRTQKEAERLPERCCPDSSLPGCLGNPLLAVVDLGRQPLPFADFQPPDSRVMGGLCRFFPTLP